MESQRWRANFLLKWLKMTDDIKVMVPVPITGQMVSDLLITAFEGGANYWIIDISLFDLDVKRTASLTDHPVQNLSTIKIVESVDGSSENHTLNMPSMENSLSLENGLKVMAEKYPRHFANVISDDADAETADVFLQCCLFGEVRYG